MPCVCGRQSHSDIVYNVPMSICITCASSLMRNTSKNDTVDNDDDDDNNYDSVPAPPTLAIANGFAVGLLPAPLRDVTVHEAALVAPYPVKQNKTTQNTAINKKKNLTTPT